MGLLESLFVVLAVPILEMVGILWMGILILLTTYAEFPTNVMETKEYAKAHQQSVPMAILGFIWAMVKLPLQVLLSILGMFYSDTIVLRKWIIGIFGVTMILLFWSLHGPKNPEIPEFTPPGFSNKYDCNEAGEGEDLFSCLNRLNLLVAGSKFLVVCDDAPSVGGLLWEDYPYRIQSFTCGERYAVAIPQDEFTEYPFEFKYEHNWVFYQEDGFLILQESP